MQHFIIHFDRWSSRGMNCIILSERSWGHGSHSSHLTLILTLVQGQHWRYAQHTVISYIMSSSTAQHPPILQPVTRGLRCEVSLLVTDHHRLVSRQHCHVPGSRECLSSSSSRPNCWQGVEQWEHEGHQQNYLRHHCCVKYSVKTNHCSHVNRSFNALSKRL